MLERRSVQRHRTLLGGKILFNERRSVIDCLVRNLSDFGACLQVNNTVGIPRTFDLLVEGEERSISSRVTWTSENRLGVSFPAKPTTGTEPTIDKVSRPPASPGTANGERHSTEVLRGEMLALRAALDEIPIGVVLLDAETRAQFINREFRRMWRMPDVKADSKPPFVALVYHGRDTLAYAIPHGDLDAYVRERVALVKAGSTKPIDIRLANGEVVRFQCTVLPAGGRMLCYTYVTDIVSHSDDLDILRAALDSVQQGVILLDPFMNAQFMNRAVRRLWNVPAVSRHIRSSSTTRGEPAPTPYRRQSWKNSSPIVSRWLARATPRHSTSRIATGGSSAPNAPSCRVEGAC